jgi:hypothetical protein
MNLWSNIAFQAWYRMLWSRGSRNEMPRASASDVVNVGSMLTHSDECAEKVEAEEVRLYVDLTYGMFGGTLLLDAPSERLLVRGLSVLGTTILRGRRVEAVGTVRIE